MELWITAHRTVVVMVKGRKLCRPTILTVLVTFRIKAPDIIFPKGLHDIL